MTEKVGRIKSQVRKFFDTPASICTEVVLVRYGRLRLTRMSPTYIPWLHPGSIHFPIKTNLFLRRNTWPFRS